MCVPGGWPGVPVGGVGDPGGWSGAPGGRVGAPGGGVGLGLGVWPDGNHSVATQVCGPRKRCLDKAMVFPVVMYGCES